MSPKRVGWFRVLVHLLARTRPGKVVLIRLMLNAAQNETWLLGKVDCHD